MRAGCAVEDGIRFLVAGIICDIYDFLVCNYPNDRGSAWHGQATGRGGDVESLQVALLGVVATRVARGRGGCLGGTLTALAGVLASM